MTRLLTAGFESGTVAGEGMTTGGTAPAIASDRVRSGGFALKPLTGVRSIAQWAASFPAGRSHYFRFYVQLDTDPAAQTPICQLNTVGNANWIALAVSTTGRLVLDASGGFTPSTGSAQVFFPDTWHRVEVRVKVEAAGNDEVEVRVDGVTTHATASAAWATAEVAEIEIGPIATTTVQMWIDDIAVNDDQGASDNSWPGQTPALDQNLGSSADDTLAASKVLTTTAAAAAGTLIVLFAYTWNDLSVGLSVASSPSLSWSVDVVNSSGSFDQCWIASAYAPAGFASGSTITATWTDAIDGGRFMGAASFTGIDSADPFDKSAVNDQASTASWSSGAETNALRDALYVAVSGSEGSGSQTNSPTVGSEIHQLAVGTEGQEMCSQYLVVSSAAARALTGTWSGTSSSLTNALVIYNGAAAAVVPSQKVRPDGDVVTTGWAIAPLHSKLADESDATVITATLA